MTKKTVASTIVCVTGLAALALCAFLYSWLQPRVFLLLKRYDAGSRVAWSPDGMRLATANSLGTLSVWDASVGRHLVTTTDRHEAHVRSVDWSPDGRWLASGGHDGTVKIWGAVSGQLILTIPDSFSTVAQVAWDPSGRRLALADQDLTYVYDLSRFRWLGWLE